MSEDEPVWPLQLIEGKYLICALLIRCEFAALADRVAAEAADRARFAYISYTQRTTQTVYCAVDALGSGVSGEGHRSWSA